MKYRIFAVRKCAALFAIACAFLLCFSSTQAAPRKILHGHVPSAVSKGQRGEKVPATKRLDLAIALPLRNDGKLTDFLQQLYDPSSPLYHQYLTPAQFAERFGPTEEDYQKVIAFANAYGLTVTGTHGNRGLLDVNASVSAIEQAFHVNL